MIVYVVLSGLVQSCPVGLKACSYQNAIFYPFIHYIAYTVDKRIKGRVGSVFAGSGSGGSGNIMGKWLVGQRIVGVISFQKIFRLCGLKGHAVEIRWYVTLELRTDNGWTDGI